jgi:hypothetical protein
MGKVHGGGAEGQHYQNAMLDRVNYHLIILSSLLWECLQL